MMDHDFTIDALGMTNGTSHRQEHRTSNDHGGSLQDLMERCWAAIRQSSHFAIDVETGMEYLNAPIRTEDRRYICPLPGCEKTFSSDLGLNYHFTHGEHDVTSIILSALSTTGLSDSELEKQREQLFQQANDIAAEGNFPIQQPIVVYYNGVRRRDIFAIFGRGKQMGTVSSSDSNRKRSKTGTPTLSQSSSTHMLENLETSTTPTLVEMESAAPSPPKMVMFHEPVVVRHYLHQEVEAEYLGRETRIMVEDKIYFPEWIIESEDVEMVSDASEASYLPSKEYTVDLIFQSKSQGSKLVTLELPCLKTAVPLTAMGGYVLNVGACIWGLAWCPLTRSGMKEETVHHHYLAVAGYRHMKESQSVGSFSMGPGWIQFWRFPTLMDSTLNYKEQPHLDMVLAHDYGTVWDLKWCPRYAFLMDSGTFQRMGILSVAFGDGKIRLFPIPSPNHLKEKLEIHDKSMTVVFKLRPCLVLDVRNTIPWSISWSSDDTCRYLASGCTDGTMMMQFDRSIFVLIIRIILHLVVTMENF
jgi:hypothetical protein